MGKRKERRLAALTGAGRRVKLDLFAEPSGDLGGSPAEEVEGGVETKLEAGLPKSPSSSGHQPANPLSLLGQYSDDDMEEGSSDDNRVHQDTTQAENDEQIKSNRKELEESIAASNEEPSAEKNSNFDLEKDAATSGSLQGLGNNNVGENNAAVKNNVSHEEHPEPPQNSIPLASDIQIQATGNDLKSCWKMVLHEQSNGYYYWNTVTGETSWEVPADFAQGAALLMSEPQASAAEDNAHRDLYASGVTVSADDVSYSFFPSASLIAQSLQEYKGDESQLISRSGAFNQENLTLGNYSSYVPPTVPIVGCWVGTSGSSSIYMQGGMINNQDEAALLDLPSQLVRRSESLLEKLRSLRGSEGNSNEQHAWTSKYISEIEIRLFDLNSLLSYGSSLAQFWLHSETQLKRLEDAVNSEIGSYVESELKNETSSVLLPLDDGRETKQENGEGEADLGKSLKKALSSGKSCNELDDVKLPSDVQYSLLDGTSCDGIPSIKQGPELANDMTQVGEEENISNEATVVANVCFEPEPHAVEEEDMDIDMEVEDTSLPTDATAVEIVYSHTFPSEHLCPPSAPADKQSLASEVESVAPPPPDDDWIPPPPTDIEEIPPPPPDEPPESFCVPPPPSSTQAVETLTYPASYSLTYPDPNYSYYGHAGVTLPNQSVYYETVPSSHAEAAGTLNNQVGSAVYYAQDSAAPVVSAEAPSSFQVALAPSGYDGISSNLAGTDCAQVQMASFQNSNADPYALHGVADPITSQPSNTSISTAACATTQESILASHASTSASSAAFIAPSTVAPSTAAAKPQPKALRVKKRTVPVASSLRSNKKVSSLVDKWKAAKEEMQEAEEEEVEDSLMILEKKRQREIEEWRAQQIASGEARENANFQPLGGDWRERVKRKRARRAASAETPAEETVAEKQQPNSSEHSRGLPPGWKAYWDESSKQVYYGNTITSETTWTRPT